MADIKQTVTRTNESGLDAQGTPVNQQTRRVQTEATADPKSTVQNVVWYIVGFIEVLVALRFVLKLLGANPTSQFVDLVYNVTGVLTAPFDTIFGVTSTTTGEVQSVFEPSIVVAALVYVLIAWGIVKLISINQKDS